MGTNRLTARRWSNDTVRVLSDVEAAWVGAMIDGEGGVRPMRHSNGLDYPSIEFTNCDVELIATMLRVVGAGTIKPKQDAGHTQCWVWALRRAKPVASILPQIRPYSVKAQAAEVWCGTSAPIRRVVELPKRIGNPYIKPLVLPTVPAPMPTEPIKEPVHARCG